MMMQGKYPTKYPPVGPKRIWGPPWKEENTGKPMTPSSKYKTITKGAYFQSSKEPVMYKIKVAKVIGIGPTGIDKGERTHIKAKNKAVRHICLIKGFLKKGKCSSLFTEWAMDFSSFSICRPG